MKNLKSLASKAIGKAWFYPLALLFIGIIAYLLMLPKMGFYWDDWEGVYLYKLHNPALSFHYYAERPVSALIYLGLFPLIKMTPAVTHTVALLLRWGGILFIYYTLNLIWPTRKPVHQWIGALMIVFPGFSEQPLSVAFTPHLGTFLLFSSSLFLTALAFRDRKRFWIWFPLSLVTGITQIFMMEYFVVLEILRPLVIWFILRTETKKEKETILKAFLYWLPFLAGLVVYLWWRLAYLPTTMVGGDPNNPSLLKAFLNSPLNSFLALGNKVMSDLRYMFVDIWANGFFSVSSYDPHAKVLWLGWFAGILIAVIFGLYNNRITAQSPSDSEKHFLSSILFGISAFLAGGFPVWMTNRQASLGKWSDRFSLAPLLGIVILLVCILDWLFRTKKQKLWAMILLLGLSISTQIWNTNSYRLDWGLQQSIYWQLAWRVPALQPGTAIIGRGTFTDKSSYYDGTYIMNLLFSQKPAANPQYAYLDVFHVFRDDDGNYTPGQPLSYTTRSGTFTGNTSQAIGMYFTQSGGCVRILDQVYLNDPNFISDASSFDRLNELIAISNVSLIDTAGDPLKPDPSVFGAEPAHGWCFYFEKADLARQEQDWQTVLELGSQAQAKGLRPTLGAEDLPFIEAHAQTGEWSKAYELSMEAFKTTRDLETSLCNNWTRFAGIQGGADRDLYLARAQAEFCRQSGE